MCAAPPPPHEMRRRHGGRPLCFSAPPHPHPTLQRYSLHHKIDVSSAAKGYSVLAAWGSGVAGAAAAPEREWPKDPRLPALGRRTILPRGSAPAPTASPADYQLWRIKQGVAEGDTEIPSGAAPLRRRWLDCWKGGHRGARAQERHPTRHAALLLLPSF